MVHPSHYLKDENRMLWTPAGSGDFGAQVSNIDGIRPAASNGTFVTADATPNTKGAYVEVLTSANVAFDAFGLYITTIDVGSSTTLMDVGVDPSGGSSYSVLIPNLLMGSSQDLTTGGITFYFPIWVKAGSSIAVRTQSTSGGNANAVIIKAVGKPRDQSLTWVGTYCTDFGTDLANSTGTLVTSGTVSEGAWTQLAASIAKDHRYWQMGFDTDVVSIADNVYFADIAYGDGSNKIIIIQDQIFYSVSATNSLATGSRLAGCGRLVKNGNNVYGRLQVSGTPDTNTAMIAYGVG